MVVEESAMTDEVLNTLVVLGHRLLLVEVGGGFETHLCEATSDSAARAALDTPPGTAGLIGGRVGTRR
jgi:hypothetical protein